MIIFGFGILKRILVVETMGFKVRVGATQMAPHLHKLQFLLHLGLLTLHLNEFGIPPARISSFRVFLSFSVGSVFSKAAQPVSGVLKKVVTRRVKLVSVDTLSLELFRGWGIGLFGDLKPYSSTYSLLGSYKGIISNLLFFHVGGHIQVEMSPLWEAKDVFWRRVPVIHAVCRFWNPKPLHPSPNPSHIFNVTLNSKHHTKPNLSKSRSFTISFLRANQIKYAQQPLCRTSVPLKKRRLDLLYSIWIPFQPMLSASLSNSPSSTTTSGSCVSPTM